MNNTILDHFEIEKGISEGNWTLLRAYAYPFDAELVMLQEALHEAAIPSVVLDKSNGAINPLLGGSGTVHLFVPTETLSEAKQILDNQTFVTQQVYDNNPPKGISIWVKLLFIILVLFCFYQLIDFLNL